MATKAELLEIIKKKISKDRLEEMIEDYYLSKKAKEAKKEGGRPIPFEELKKEILGK